VVPNNCSHLTFLKKSCSLGLARWFATKLHNSQSFWSISMKILGFTCLDMKNICGRFRGKQPTTRKVIALVFLYVNPHLAYLIEWRIYASFRTLCIWTYDAYMRHSSPKVSSNLKILLALDVLLPKVMYFTIRFCSTCTGQIIFYTLVLN